MSNEEYYKLSENIFNLDPGIRFVTILGNQGQIIFGGNKQGIENYLDSHDQRLSAEHILRSWKLRREFEDAIGKSKFVMAQYEKIRRYTIPIDLNHLLFITTEAELTNTSFIQNTLELVETFKRSSSI
ncbi:MAG: hypothetical protein OEM18_07365 [Nitrosopumilus sp.]|jgi:hypothetical protein|nr:hypothetical protein [Nitrosopumilus sp.]MDH3502028.1 hypothetical protein [Nitrosopumilus sp.]